MILRNIQKTNKNSDNFWKNLAGLAVPPSTYISIRFIKLKPFPNKGTSTLDVIIVNMNQRAKDVILKLYYVYISRG